jgi:amidase
MHDTVNAFIEMFDVRGAIDGPLAGRTVGVKDIYDVAGHITGYGNPDWARTHNVSEITAPAVQALLDAGARLVGKTLTDELAYSLMGVNAHYGTPLNTAAPDRVPGGSSSGSVAATAAGLVDIGLGSDTGGSVRLPASFCGVYGLRSTHGRISLTGARPLAPSFDTVGWFARDAKTFAATGQAYGITVGSQPLPRRFVLATDAFARVAPESRNALAPALNALHAHADIWEEMDVSGNHLADWRQTFQVCQAGEIWASHGDWIRSVRPAFGPGIKERFEMASRITPDQRAAGARARAEIAEHVRAVLGDDGIIVSPTSPGPAPLRTDTDVVLDQFRTAALEILCLAGLAGLPQVNLPAAKVDGAPLGLSLMAPPGRDEWLLSLALTC